MFHLSILTNQILWMIKGFNNPIPSQIHESTLLLTFHVHCYYFSLIQIKHVVFGQEEQTLYHCVLSFHFDTSLLSDTTRKMKILDTICLGKGWRSLLGSWWRVARVIYYYQQQQWWWEQQTTAGGNTRTNIWYNCYYYCIWSVAIYPSFIMG